MYPVNRKTIIDLILTTFDSLALFSLVLYFCPKGMDDVPPMTTHDQNQKLTVKVQPPFANCNCCHPSCSAVNREKRKASMGGWGGMSL